MSATRRLPIEEWANCPCSGATLDKLVQPAILTILAGGGLHGYKIAERIADMPPFKGQKPDVSGVYRSLRSMEQRGLVAASWDVSNRGPAKRLYQLTPDGHECLSRWVETLDTYRKAIGSLLALARRATQRAASMRQRRTKRKDKGRDA